MKDKQVACLVLIILTAVMAFGTQKVFQKKSAASKLAAEKVSAANNAKTLFNTSQIALTRLKSDTKEVREFHSAWEPYLAATKNWQSTEQRLVDSTKTNDVFANELRFEILDRKGDPLIKQVLRAHITVDDEYSKVFNWFGEIEESFPTSRVTSCTVKRGKDGDNLRIQLILDFPVAGGKA